MSVTELIPTLKSLSRAEKLRIMEFLAQELEVEEKEPSLKEGASYPVWSPLDCHGAAQALSALLEPEQRADYG